MSKKKSHRKASVPAAKPNPAGKAQPAAEKKSTSASRAQARKSQKKTAYKKSLWYLLGAIAVLVVSLAAYVSITRSASQPAITQISPNQAYQKYQSGAFFLDVRTQAEWDQEHIPNSTLIPLDNLASRLGELPKDREIVVVCLIGKRSQEGQQMLAQAGFKNAFCLKGGIQAWKTAGYPTESG